MQVIFRTKSSVDRILLTDITWLPDGQDLINLLEEKYIEFIFWNNKFLAEEFRKYLRVTINI